MAISDHILFTAYTIAQEGRDKRDNLFFVDLCLLSPENVEQLCRIGCRHLCDAVFALPALGSILIRTLSDPSISRIKASICDFYPVYRCRDNHFYLPSKPMQVELSDLREPSRLQKIAPSRSFLAQKQYLHVYGFPICSTARLSFLISAVRL